MFDVRFIMQAPSNRASAFHWFLWWTVIYIFTRKKVKGGQTWLFSMCKRKWDKGPSEKCIDPQNRKQDCTHVDHNQLYTFTF